MKVYVPPQHTAKPYGCEHETVFASIELWVDSPPDLIALGELRYRLERDDRDKEDME